MKRLDGKRMFAGMVLAVVLVSLICGSTFASSVVKNKAFGTEESVAHAKHSNSKTEFHFEGTSMYTYPMMQADIRTLQEKYGDVFADSIGSTEDGRQLYRLVIGNRNAEKKLLITASMHAREYIGTPLVLREAKDLLERKKNGDDRLDHICIQLIPMWNPDGVGISQYGIGGLSGAAAKKAVNRIIQSWAEWGLLEDQNKYTWYLNKWKNNANGVDLNRNFPTPGFLELNDLRNKPANDLYKGPAPASEFETKAMIALVQKERFDAVLNYHSQGQVIYWANVLASEELQKKNGRMAEIAKKNTGYQLISPAGEGKGGASFKDWLDRQMGIPNITLEIGLGTAPVPETQIETIWEQNKNLIPDLVDDILGRTEALSVRLNISPESTLEKDSHVQFVAPREE